MDIVGPRQSPPKKRKLQRAKPGGKGCRKHAKRKEGDPAEKARRDVGHVQLFGQCPEERQQHDNRPAICALGQSSWVDKFEIKAGQSLLTRVFDEGLQVSDFVCAFITNNSQSSKWVREELEFAFLKSIEDGKPRIIVLRFDKATVPSFLRTRRYLTLDRQEIGTIVNQIMENADVKAPYHETEAKPFSTLDFHDALRGGTVTYILASRRDPLDVDPLFDPEAIQFHRRHLFVLKVHADQPNALKCHHLSLARPAHTAMRVIGSQLLIFVNDKVRPQDFSMIGRVFRLDAETLRPTSVDAVFEDRNWGWDPWLDENGILHHKDFETPGNPYRVGDAIVHEKTWHDLAATERKWRDDVCPYPTAYGPGRDTGYLRFLDVDPNSLVE